MQKPQHSIVSSRSNQGCDGTSNSTSISGRAHDSSNGKRTLRHPEVVTDNSVGHDSDEAPGLLHHFICAQHQQRKAPLLASTGSWGMASPSPLSTGTPTSLTSPRCQSPLSAVVAAAAATATAVAVAAAAATAAKGSHDNNGALLQKQLQFQQQQQIQTSPSIAAAATSLADGKTLSIQALINFFNQQQQLSSPTSADANSAFHVSASDAVYKQFQRSTSPHSFLSNRPESPTENLSSEPPSTFETSPASKRQRLSSSVSNVSSMAVKRVDAGFECSVCSKLFGYKQHVQTHIRTVHLKIKPHACDKCDKTFGERSALKKHTRTVHEGIRPFKCGTCQRGFGQKAHLAKHLSSKTQCFYSAGSNETVRVNSDSDKRNDMNQMTSWLKVQR